MTQYFDSIYPISYKRKNFYFRMKIYTRTEL